MLAQEIALCLRHQIPRRLYKRIIGHCFRYVSECAKVEWTLERHFKTKCNQNSVCCWFFLFLKSTTVNHVYCSTVLHLIYFYTDCHIDKLSIKVTTCLTVFVASLTFLVLLEVPPPCRVCNKIRSTSLLEIVRIFAPYSALQSLLLHSCPVPCQLKPVVQSKYLILNTQCSKYSTDNDLAPC